MHQKDWWIKKTYNDKLSSMFFIILKELFIIKNNKKVASTCTLDSTNLNN